MVASSVDGKRAGACYPKRKKERKKERTRETAAYDKCATRNRQLCTIAQPFWETWKKHIKETNRLLKLHLVFLSALTIKTQHGGLSNACIEVTLTRRIHQASGKQARGGISSSSSDADVVLELLPPAPTPALQPEPSLQRKGAHSNAADTRSIIDLGLLGNTSTALWTPPPPRARCQENTRSTFAAGGSLPPIHTNLSAILLAASRPVARRLASFYPPEHPLQIRCSRLFATDPHRSPPLLPRLEIFTSPFAFYPAFTLQSTRLQIRCSSLSATDPHHSRAFVPSPRLASRFYHPLCLFAAFALISSNQHVIFSAPHTRAPE